MPARERVSTNMDAGMLAVTSALKTHHVATSAQSKYLGSSAAGEMGEFRPRH